MEATAKKANLSFWGNPTAKEHEILNSPHFLDDIYEAIIEEYPLSAILSDNVKEQVATVESELSAASKPEHRLRLTNALSYDRKFSSYHQSSNAGERYRR